MGQVGVAVMETPSFGSSAVCAGWGVAFFRDACRGAGEGRRSQALAINARLGVFWSLEAAVHAS